MVSVEYDKIAFLICDMWESHWCKSANKRYGRLAKTIGKTVDSLHDLGVIVIHSPRSVIEYYSEYPQRKKMRVTHDDAIPLSHNPFIRPPLPFDSTTCSCGCSPNSVWTRQHPAITIGEQDAISDSVREIYFFLKSKHINHLYYAGVALNQCMLNNEFGIPVMNACGLNCVLVRDLTDVWYNTDEYPLLTRSTALELMVKHIENHYCSSILSSELFQS